MIYATIKTGMPQDHFLLLLTPKVSNRITWELNQYIMRWIFQLISHKENSVKQMTDESNQVQFKRITRAHIIQSLIAGLYIFFVLMLMYSYQNNLVVASLGASAFIAFSFPNAQSSRPRFLIGGYCVGSTSGMLCNGLVAFLQDVLLIPEYIIACALAVFLSMIFMTILNFEHPPSAALAIAITIDPNPIILALAGLGCIIALCVLKELLKKHLRNL